MFILFMMKAGLNVMQIYECPSQLNNLRSTAKRFCANETISMCLEYGFSLFGSSVVIKDQVRLYNFQTLRPREEIKFAIQFHIGF